MSSISPRARYLMASCPSFGCSARGRPAAQQRRRRAPGAPVLSGQRRARRRGASARASAPRLDRAVVGRRRPRPPSSSRRRGPSARPSNGRAGFDGGAPCLCASGASREEALRAPLWRGPAGGARFMYGITAADVTAMYFSQHKCPAVSTAPYFLHRIMAG